MVVDVGLLKRVCGWEYECLPPEKVAKMMREQVAKLAVELAVPCIVAQSLLERFSFNVDEIRAGIQQRGDAGAWMQELGFNINSLSEQRPSAPGNAGCPICLDNAVGDEDVIVLPCQHQFCSSCLRQYLEHQSADSGSTKCPLCSVAIDSVTAMQLLDDSQFLKFNSSQLRRFVQRHPKLRWCPGRECNNAIMLKTRMCNAILSRTCANSSRSVGQVEVRCSCSTRFCFMCGRVGHWPAPCHVVGWYDMLNGTQFVVRIGNQQQISCCSQSCHRSRWLIAN